MQLSLALRVGMGMVRQPVSRSFRDTLGGVALLACALALGFALPADAKGPRGSSGRYAAQARAEAATHNGGAAAPAGAAAASGGGSAGYRGGHSHSAWGWGIAVGAPLWFGSMYAPSFPYYPGSHVVLGSRPDVTYIEKSPATAAAPAPDYYWYYCPDSRIYYPYAEQCASPWLPVVPTPPAEAG